MIFIFFTNLIIKNMRKTYRIIFKPFVAICLGLIITGITLAASYEVPNPPGTPMIIDVWKDGCLLQYLEPHNGGAPITRYIIEYRKKWGLKWELKGTSPTLLYQVEGMREGSSAEFRVRAENRYGVSEPSDPSPMIQFKDRL